MNKYKFSSKLKSKSNNFRSAYLLQSSNHENEPKINLDNINKLNTDDHDIPHCYGMHGAYKDDIHELNELIINNKPTKYHSINHKKSNKKKSTSYKNVKILLGAIVILLLIVFVVSILKFPKQINENKSREKKIFPLMTPVPTQEQVLTIPPKNHLNPEIQEDSNDAVTQLKNREETSHSSSNSSTEEFSLLTKLATVEPDCSIQSQQKIEESHREILPHQKYKQEKNKLKYNKAKHSHRETMKIEENTIMQLKDVETAAYNNKVVSDSNVSNLLKSTLIGYYTLQLSSSSNYINLNDWAKRSNLKNYTVYETIRNGQPWYVLVSGVYTSKEEAMYAISTLPKNVQLKNPWVKSIRQIQADLEYPSDKG